jgi:hypothetical protein
MTYTKNGAGRGSKGAESRDKRPARRREPVSPDAKATHDRAYQLVQAAWAAERWKSSITTKVPTYLAALVRGQKVRPPQGVPQRIVHLVHRAIARACLELGVTGLKAQDTDWYAEAVEAARKEMSPS